MEASHISYCGTGLSVQGASSRTNVCACKISRCSRSGVIALAGSSALSQTVVESCSGPGVIVATLKDHHPLRQARVGMRSTHVRNNGGTGMTVLGTGAYAHAGHACRIEGNVRTGVLVVNEARLKLDYATVQSEGPEAMAAVVVMKGRLCVTNHSTLSASGTSSGCAVVLHRIHGTRNVMSNDIGFRGTDSMHVGFALPDWFDIAAMHWDVRYWRLGFGSPAGLLRHRAFGQSPSIWNMRACMLVLPDLPELLPVPVQQALRPRVASREDRSCWQISHRLRESLELIGASAAVDDPQLLQLQLLRGLPIDRAATLLLAVAASVGEVMDVPVLCAVTVLLALCSSMGRAPAAPDVEL